jgi:hypothetical protein
VFLRELVIRRKDAWEDKARPLVGYIRIENNAGNEIKLNLSEDAANRIVEMCADGIVEASKEVAQMLRQDVANYTALPDKSNG